ncbi:MAG: hypothetical protein ACRDCE_07860 [Cetobacterium sp.]|uniref:hypothetical protein n=1 Tax=Cetobacterium sp. TaxID=2071632 RepID=UPI003EE56B07
MSKSIRAKAVITIEDIAFLVNHDIEMRYNNACVTRENVMKLAHKTTKRVRLSLNYTVAYKVILKQALIALYTVIKAEEAEEAAQKIVVQNVCVTKDGFMQSVASELTLEAFRVLQFTTNRQYYVEVRRGSQVKSTFLFEKEELTLEMIGFMFDY